MSGAASSSVRVRRLELRAETRDDVLPFRNDLEDALRTASLPVLPGGASLHVRRLALGRIPRGLSRQALAGQIAARLAQLPVALLRPGIPQDQSAGAVVIPDPVSAAVLVLEAALAGAPLHWALADRFLDLPPSAPAEIVTRVLDDLLARFGAAGPGRLVLASGECALMMRALTIVPEAALGAWLAPVAMALPPDLALMIAGEPPVRSAAEAAPAADPPASRFFARASRGEGIAPALSSIMAAAVARWGARSPRATLMVAWTGVAMAGPAALVPTIRHLRLQEELFFSKSVHRKSDYLDEVHDTDTRAREGRVGAEPQRASVDVVSADEQAPAPVQALGALSALADFDGEPSEVAGFWLLLPLVRLAGAEAAEAALDVPLCRDVLGSFARRLGMRADDPVLAVLEPPFSERAALSAGRWRPRDRVLEILAGRSGLRLSRAGPGRTVLGLAHGPFGFATLAARDLAEIRHTLSLRIHRREVPDYAAFLGAMILAVQVLAWRLTGQGWRRLARRRGRVRIGPTHVDIIYDGRDVDVAVRRAGLDIDPGWVAWLGRVVNFRYDYAQVRDFQPPEPGP